MPPSRYNDLAHDELDRSLEVAISPVRRAELGRRRLSDASPETESAHEEGTFTEASDE